MITKRRTKLFTQCHNKHWLKSEKIWSSSHIFFLQKSQSRQQMLFEMIFFCRLILQLTRIYLAFINQCVGVATSHVTGRKKDTQNVFTFSWPFWLKLLLTNFFTVPFHLRMFKFWRQNFLWLVYYFYFQISNISIIERNR